MKSTCLFTRLGAFVLIFLLIASSHQAEAEQRFVKRVVDGDTLVLENGERVRLIGVDTPETKHPKKPVEHFRKEATAFTRKMVQGKRVRLGLIRPTHT